MACTALASEPDGWPGRAPRALDCPAALARKAVVVGEDAWLAVVLLCDAEDVGVAGPVEALLSRAVRTDLAQGDVEGGARLLDTRQSR